MASTEPVGRTGESAQRAYARFAGLMYLVVLAFDVAGLIIASVIGGNGSFVETSHRIVASETLYRAGLCCSLAGSLSTILLAVALWVTVRPVDVNLATMALLFRVVESATGALGVVTGFAALQIHLQVSQAGAFDASQLGALADLNAHGVATDIGAIFYSVAAIVFWYLFLRSRYIPRALSVWGLFAAVLYLTVWFVALVLPSASVVTVYGSGPILIAELSTALWLLIAGIDTRPRASLG